MTIASIAWPRGAILRAAIGAAFLSASVVLAPHVARADERAAPGEAELEGRLIAPCCWTQTLDIHASEIASTLRAEVHARLQRGERAEVIEDDLAARYGAAIRAVPKGRDRRLVVPLVVGALMVVSALALALVVRRWSRAGAPRSRAVAPDNDAIADARLDAELRARADR